MTLMDHYFQMRAPRRDRRSRCWRGTPSLGFLAGRTERLELGLLVTGVTYRHPGLLARIVTTLDVLSQGRAMLGLGAAWYEREHLALGVPYPSTRERFERLEETILVLRQMFGDDDGPFEGQHYRLAETINNPQVVRPGGPRLVIGGGGERKTLRMVAQYADATNLFAGSGGGPAATSSTCCASTATTSGATTTRSPRPWSARSSDPSTTSTRGSR